MEDQSLIQKSIAGDCDAFGLLVGQYQGIVIGVAFSGLGNFSESEEITQQTFVIAWQNLKALRQPERFAYWLCGITRNLVRRRIQDRHRQVLPLTEAAEQVSGPDVRQEIISREEESLLWKSLETLDPKYREPLVLYYREGKSTPAVASALDISEDAVAQRLSRGRQQLRDEILKLLENTLEKCRPGAGLTAAIVTAITTTQVKAGTTLLSAAGPTAVGAGSMGWVGVKSRRPHRSICDT